MSRQEIAAHLQFLREIGVTGVSRDPAWRARDGDAQVEPAAAPAPRSEAAAIETAAEGARADVVDALAGLNDLDSLRAHIGVCTRCKLCRLGRSQVVFGVGNPNAELMFVGEAPGADEDRLGEP